MGFFGRIPATELKARYNTVSKQLILFASGEAVRSTSAITFQRQQFVGGLKFALNGWVGPITGGKQQMITPSRFLSSFQIELSHPTRLSLLLPTTQMARSSISSTLSANLLLTALEPDPSSQPQMAA
jgi:hypothetical protein